MTQPEFLLDLDCSTDDLGHFLYEDDPIEQHRLALGTLLDLVASAFDMSGTRAAIAFDARFAQLPAEPLGSLRLALDPASGEFAVQVAARDRPNGYESAASGHRLALPEWPDGTLAAAFAPLGESDADAAYAELSRSLHAQLGLSAAFGDVRALQPLARGVSIELALTPGARAECEGFSVHPALLNAALRAALLVRSRDAQAARVAGIERVAVFSPGAVPTRMAVVTSHDDEWGSCTAHVALLDESDRIVAALSGIEFGARESTPTWAALSSTRLAELAVEALGRAVPPQANLLQLGLSSLDLVRLVTVVYGESHRQVSLEAFLTCPTLEHLHALTSAVPEARGVDLAERLEQLVAASPGPTPEPSPLTSMQQALWLASLKPSAAPAYVESVAWRVRGELDIAALNAAWVGLTEHFESLRSAIFEQAGHFTQRVLPTAATLARQLATTAELAEGHAIEAWLRAELERGFLAEERLARIAVLRIASDDHVLLLAAHHAICDGSSFAERVLPELAELYACARQRRDPPAVRSSAQPRHLAAWELDPACAEPLAAEATRWANELSDVDETELPGDHPRSPQAAQRGRRHEFALPAELSERLENFAQRAGQSRFVVTLAAFGALLYRYAGLQDVLVGVPVAQRFAPSLTQAAGCLINFAPVRLRLSGALSADALLHSAGDEVARLLNRQRIPYQWVARLLSDPRQANAANPRVGFSHENALPALELPGLELTRLQPELTHAKLELFLRLESSPNGLRGVFEYDADLFEDLTIRSLAERFARLLDTLIATPAILVKALPWLGAAEQRALLAATRGPSLPGAVPMSSLLARRLRPGTDLLAVTDGARELSYAELDARARTLERALRAAGVTRGECVVIYLEACLEWPIAVFGCWRAGAVMVPIDANQPRGRQAHMFAAAQARVAISHARHASEVSSFGLQPLAIDDAQLVAADADAAALSSDAASHAAWDLRADDLAYGIFTSGSTGVPKLALANHGGLANKALAQLATFRLAEGTRVLQFASPAFDAALSELILAMSAGASLWVPPREARYSGEALATFMQRAQIEVAMLTPSVVASLHQLELPALRLLLIIGERCAGELVDRWGPGRHVYNLYGPTETTIWATGEHCQPNSGDPNIGRAIPNAWVYILDSDLNLLGPGQIGEICIGGAGVGPGYKYASEIDRARFVADPYAGDENARIYRSGDRGRCLPDGRLEFLGRNDDQVKLSGRRIALGEIESALRHLEGVEEAVVVVHEQGTPRARLSAFVQTRIDDISSIELRNRLRSTLPNHMIPTSLAIIEQWPRLISGKIDRKELASRPLQRALSGSLSIAAEQAVAEAFGRVLGLDPASIGPDDDFFALGGRSLDVVMLAEELARVGVMVSVAELLQAGRVSELATLAESDTCHSPVHDL
jgi:amino acid adenylation domain-containing protein